MPSGTYAAVRFGMPQPRFTQAPSGSSRAARAAICSRVSLALDIAQPLGHDDSIHKNKWGHNVFGIESADFHNVLNFHERGLGRGGHDRIKISRAFSKHEVAELVGTMRFDKRII